ncbi:MAG: SdpI family protein [Lachnospiraceae bacterium]|nr:SdpI family protein [Lachnospiraceae bacterium]
MKTKKTLLIITTLVCLLPMLIAAFVYQDLPAQIATHWGADGTPNGYSSKAFACFGLPAIMAGLNIFVNILLDNDPKRKNVNNRILMVSKWCIPVVSLVASTLTLAFALGYKVSISRITPAMVGVLLIALGNYLPKCKQNYTVGIKLPWTLNSEENWNRTHHLSGYLFILAGIVMTITAFIPNAAFLTLPFILIAAIIPMIYSFVLFKKGI